MAPRKKIKPSEATTKKALAKRTRTTLDILNEWTQRGLYIYLRALTSKYEHPDEPHVVVWKVKVEYRNVDWFQHEAESRVTPDAAIHELDKIVPKEAKHSGRVVRRSDASANRGRRKKNAKPASEPTNGRRKKKPHHAGT